LIKQNFNILMRGRKLRSDKANGVSEEWWRFASRRMVGLSSVFRR
jgi:hypothetical protein